MCQAFNVVIDLLARSVSAKRKTDTLHFSIHLEGIQHMTSLVASARTRASSGASNTVDIEQKEQHIGIIRSRKSHIQYGVQASLVASVKFYSFNGSTKLFSHVFFKTRHVFLMLFNMLVGQFQRLGHSYNS